LTKCLCRSIDWSLSNAVTQRLSLSVVFWRSLFRATIYSKHFQMAAATKGLIFLEAKSAILHEQLRPRILEGKREPCEINFSDFDGVSFRISCQHESMNVVNVAMVMKTTSILKTMGSQEMITRLFPGAERAPPAGFDFALEFDCDAIGGDPEEFLNNISELKRNMMGGPLYTAFTALVNKTSAGMAPMVVPYRKGECMFVCPSESKVTVIFLVDFVDITDKAIAKVFLQEFVEAQRTNRNAPPVTYSHATPPDLRSVEHTANPEAVGYLSFAVEERHIKGDKNLQKAMTLMTGFRNYLHYHIKCSKTYLHMRMRKRVVGWMQVLNRAIPEKEEGEKKTAAGKTFVRK
jgi:actin related protein 2/3 complex subunit 2